MILKNKDKQMLDNHTKAILKLSDMVGQMMVCLNANGIKFEYKEGLLIDEKTNDKTTS